jgi:hypothetical protein
VGEVRYYVGRKLKTRCRDPKATFDGILEATGGDMDAVKECLSSDPFKQGAVKRIEGIDFPKLYEVTVDDELREGAPLKHLLETNPKWSNR